MANVRPAVAEDIPELVEMGRDMHAESPRYAPLSFNADKVEALARRLIEGTLLTPAPGGALVAENEGKLVGMLSGFVSTPFFSDDKFATDYAFYVRPEWRGKGSIAARLIKAFEAWAIANGARDIIPGISAMVNEEGTARLFEALGYTRCGITLMKRIR